MDIISDRWLSELEMEDEDYPFMNECQLNSLDHSFDHDFNFESFSSESHSSYPDFDPNNSTPNNFSNTVNSSIKTHVHEKPAKQLLTATKAAASSSSSQLISFGNPNSQVVYGNFDCTRKRKDKMGIMSQAGNINLGSLIPQGSHENQNYSPNSGQGTQKNATMTRAHLHSQEHVLAERKRREKLSLKFIALSALIPGLKKMDKASVLGDAVKYMKQLQERVTTLEEQTAKKTMESVVFVKRSRLSADDHDSSSSGENFVSRSDQTLPEIEARVSEKDVLIRIHCEKQKGFMVQIISEIEKLHLTVTNSSALPFGNYAMDITVLAQMDVEFCMKIEDLVKSLRQAFLKFM